MSHLKNTCSAVLLLVTSTLWGQDAHLSQYYAAPQLTNPALTGVFSGSMRASSNYREQWSNIFANVPFRTFTAAADYRLNVVEDDYIGLGINALYNEAGSSQFAKTQVGLGLSYLKQLSGNRSGSEAQYLIAGAQLGLGQHQLKSGDLWFSRQYDLVKEQVNTNLGNGEQFSDQQLVSPMYLDFNAGLLWYTVLNEQTNFYIGAAAHHLNTPNISFTKNTEPLYRRFSASIGGEVGLTENLSLLPNAIWMQQGKAMQIVGGAAIRYTNHDWDEIAMRVGVASRLSNKLQNSIHQDALIISTFIEMSRINIGLSYDINTSNLANATNARGAFELSIQYIHPEEKRYPVICPKF